MTVCVAAVIVCVDLAQVLEVPPQHEVSVVRMVAQNPRRTFHDLQSPIVLQTGLILARAHTHSTQLTLQARCAAVHGTIQTQEDAKMDPVVDRQEAEVQKRKRPSALPYRAPLMSQRTRHEIVKDKVDVVVVVALREELDNFMDGFHRDPTIAASDGPSTDLEQWHHYEFPGLSYTMFWTGMPMPDARAAALSL